MTIESNSRNYLYCYLKIRCNHQFSKFGIIFSQKSSNIVSKSLRPRDLATIECLAFKSVVSRQIE